MSSATTPLTYAELLREAQTPQAPNLNPGPEYADDKRLFQGIPSIERAPGGRLWAVWYAGGQGESPLNYVVLATSADGGERWTTPVLVIDPPGHVRACDPNIWLDPDGRLWLFWMQANTLHDGRWGVWAITTENPDAARPAWSAPRRLADGVMLNKPTVLANGEWLFPVSHLDMHAVKNEPRMVPRFLRRNVLGLMTPEEIAAVDARAGAMVYVTNDRGRTFTLRGGARAPDGQRSHNEHMVVERRDGSLWMLMRTSQGIASSVSADGGATWSPVVASGIPHTPSRFFLRRLRSGNILLVKHGPMEVTDAAGNPNVFKRTLLTAYLSEDDGKNWPHRLLIEEGGCTYPDGAESPDGTIHVIYDVGRRSEKIIRMSRFTEEDIRAGRFVSSRARQGMLINQATGVIPDEENWKRINELDAPGEKLIFTGI